MAKFRCIKGSGNVPVGTIIEGELRGKTIVLTKDSNLKSKNNIPYFGKGEYVPLTGHCWQWESCEGEPDKEELLARLEDAIRQDSSDYESARAELLKRLS